MPRYHVASDVAKGRKREWWVWGKPDRKLQEEEGGTRADSAVVVVVTTEPDGTKASPGLVASMGR
jgi:hypothetical protein